MEGHDILRMVAKHRGRLRCFENRYDVPEVVMLLGRSGCFGKDCDVSVTVMMFRKRF